MNLRSGAVVGAGLVPPHARAAFEEGVGLVMAEWTALALAVENEWGGPYSRDKARELVGYVASWFYGRKGEWMDGLGCLGLSLPCPDTKAVGGAEAGSAR